MLISQDRHDRYPSWFHDITDLLLFLSSDRTSFSSNTSRAIRSVPVGIQGPQFEGIIFGASARQCHRIAAKASEHHIINTYSCGLPKYKTPHLNHHLHTVKASLSALSAELATYVRLLKRMSAQHMHRRQNTNNYCCTDQEQKRCVCRCSMRQPSRARHP